MSMNRFGHRLVFSTFGESHGKGIGVLLDGMPAGVSVDVEKIQSYLDRRRPKSPYSTPRSEEDRVEIYSGVFEGVSTGAPLALFIHNKDADTSKYEGLKNLHRLGHAGFSYQKKYGIYDYRGGGRASARETVARVAAAAVVSEILGDIQVDAKVVEVGGHQDPIAIEEALFAAKQEGDSLGAVIGCEAKGVPPGLGEPLYGKAEALLSSAMLSIPATRGIEFGQGFKAAQMRGSEHNDAMEIKGEEASFVTNNHGGIQGGITTGMPIIFRVAFKPTSSIFKEQKTVTLSKENTSYQLPKGSRHDVCVALRAPIIVECMTILVLADLMLLNRCAKFSHAVH